MSKLICLLLLTAFSATFADQELENFAQKVLELLNPNSGNGNQNSLLLSLTNGVSHKQMADPEYHQGEHLTHSLLLGNSSHSLRVNVTFSGTVSVSAQRENKKVQVSTQYSGGAALAENDKESKREDTQIVPEIPDTVVNGFLLPIYNKHVEAQKVLAEDETAVLLAHGAQTGLGFKDNTRKAEAKVKGGFVVGSKTKVTKNY